MKKILIVFFCMMLVSANIFAQSDLPGNGNGGKDKIGAWLGEPSIGLSYSHEFNDLMELDLLAGVTDFLVSDGYKVNIRSGLLFTVWEPVIKGQKCPLTIGPAVDINSYILNKPAFIGLAVLCPIRWEVNFSKTPAFNLFIEVAPAIGFYYALSEPIRQDSFETKRINDKIAITWTPQIGLGLRYRIPSKK
ncbi:hypothetical protein [Treponema denticola]|uniref:hypothetical protein n=1 Tax=Treponema denticola TaxID=158 RepID=UPI0020A3F1BF|nr:hypothetical protein [Treponema denticola]UTC82884.1 hypothetical protein HGJ18_06605 [Treponema denticola]